MKVNVDGINYWVRWKHTRLPKFYNTETIQITYSSEQYLTTCTIETEGFNIVATGECSNHVSDKFEKETGRKISLDRALKSLFPDKTQYFVQLREEGEKSKILFFPDPDLKEVLSVNKSKRQIFWQAYFNRKLIKNDSNE